MTLRPFCLVHASDTLASKLAGVYHCCAMVVSPPPHTGMIEVVLMERNTKQVRETRGRLSGLSAALDVVQEDGGESHTTASSPGPLLSSAAAAATMPSNQPPSASVFPHHLDHDASVVTYTTTALSTTLPLRSVRVNVSDVSPSADVPVVPEFTSIAGHCHYRYR